jgi:hypothetical protein
MSLFVSYSHKQSEWVHSRLILVLRAAGGNVLVDIDHFKAGQRVIGQMDALQGAASRHVLVITADYVTSRYCRHEMKQAIKSDPGFADGKVLPILQDGTPLPPELKGAGGLGSGPVYVDYFKDKDAPWALLLKSCSLALRGVAAPSWLRALDQTRTHLERNESVNLVVKNGDVDWRLWIEQLKETRFKDISVVDLGHPRAGPRNGLVREILKATGRSNAAVPPPPDDLPFLADAFENGPRCHLALTHFDMVKHHNHYGLDLFSSLRWLVMDAKKVVLLAQSRAPIATLLPPQHDLSLIDFKTVELGWQSTRSKISAGLTSAPPPGGLGCSTGGPGFFEIRLRRCRR